MRAVRGRPNHKRWLSALLCVCIMLPYLNSATLAAQMDGQYGLCEHHPAHTVDCGYVEATEGRPCTHVHSEACGYVEGTPGVPCTHQHTEDCYVTDCVHIHDSACYAAAELPAEPGTGETTPPVGSGEEAPAESDTGELLPPVNSGEEAPAEPEAGELLPPVSSGEEIPAESDAGGTAPPVEIDGTEPPLAEIFEDREPVNCTHRCTEESGCVTLRCKHVHDEACGYAAPVAAACAHFHDETCGYAEAVEGQPCQYDCQLCGIKEVLSWSWGGQDEALVRNEETAEWGLTLPGASQESPVNAAVLRDLLPTEVQVELSGGTRETAPVSWDLSGVPEEGIWEGTFFIYAALPEEYRLGEGVPALAVLADLGGAETMAGLARKFLNGWSYVSSPAAQVIDNNRIVFLYSRTWSRDVLLQRLNAALPESLRGGTSGTNRWDVVNTGLKNVSDEKENCTYYDYDRVSKDVRQYTGSFYYGEVLLDWDLQGVPASLQDGDQLKLYASAVSSSTHDFFINSNLKSDHYPDDPAAADQDLTFSQKDTANNREILSMTVTIHDIDEHNHVVTPANPANTTVNLFDYCVDPARDGADGANDLLGKSEWHVGQNNNHSVRTAVEDWKGKGINDGHLLIFGDGLIHAGFWNKGAGAGTEYGNDNAGMMGIVASKLDENGYPVINTDGMDGQIPDYEKITDWKLCGDHDGAEGSQWSPAPYESIQPKNISETVQGQWDGNASLDYLFDPTQSHKGKTSHTDVKGLFQLDPMGYYYYDMRQNFAEYNEGANSFVLYDAPAAQRTDNSYENGGFGGERSVGNFLPFNTAEQVFDGVRGGKLNSSEHVKTNNNLVKDGNYLNHHLGMTVSIDFRQPAGGMVNAGISGNVPMSFQFSGDDDVWVFIDDVLVLDLGGTHSEIYGTIDFSTGAVSVGQSWKTNGFPYGRDGTVDVTALTQNAIQNTTLKKQFEDAERADTVSWKGDTFASGSDHTLRMFYLERGNYDSSLALRFNLQPQLNQQIKKVEQNGQPVQGVQFQLFSAEETGEGPGAIECFYTDSKTDDRMRVQNNQKFYVRQQPGASTPLCTLMTDRDGVAKFMDNSGNPFNFADQSERYYILKETITPSGYRPLPVDIVLYYDTETSMLSVANRWTTGAYACSVSNISGTGRMTYGAFQETGDIGSRDDLPVSLNTQRDGLVVAVPMLKQKTLSKWTALYGSNLHGFNSVRPEERTAEEWRKAVLGAALRQAAAGEGYAEWHLDWDAENNRLTGRLDDLPGLASRYQINNPEHPENADIRMVYGIIEPSALTALGIVQPDAANRYRALGEYVNTYGVEAALDAIMGVNVPNTGSNKGFSFLNVDQFNRNFRSLIYIPNERRELRVQKLDQSGNPLPGAEFKLYSDPECTNQVPGGAGITDENGILIFSPESGGGLGHAQVTWADARENTRYYLKETKAPEGYNANPKPITIVVGVYSIYADAGTADDNVSVMAGVGTLTQTMRQYAMDNDVDITLRDIVTTMQVQPSGSFQLDGWEDAVLKDTNIPRSMDLHYGMNLVKDYGVDYGLHSVDITGDQAADPGEKTHIQPFFVTDEGFIRTRVQQNYPALTGSIPKYETAKTDTNKDDLGDLDLTSLFSLLNVVVVRDQKMDPPVPGNGELRISKQLEGSGLKESDYTKNFSFTVTLTDASGRPLDGEYHYFWGRDKVGEIKSGGTITLHYDDTIIIQGLPAGTKFVVTEKQESGWHVRPSSGVISGEITADQTAGADFTNSKDPSSDLSISKTVTGEGGDTSREFTFTVALSKGGRPLTGYYKYDGDQSGELGSSGSVKLKHGQKITIHDLPVGTEYIVEEIDHEGYTVKKSGDTGTIETGKESLAAFTNDRPGLPEDPKDPPEDPKDPPEDPKDPPEDPKDPPEDPKDPPEDPKDPPEDPKNPSDKPTDLPDPNDPDSPNQITIWEDGVPKTYIKIWDPEKGEWVYIPDGEVPLIPMTRDARNAAPWEMACLASLAGLCVIFLKKKKPET